MAPRYAHIQSLWRDPSVPTKGAAGFEVDTGQVVVAAGSLTASALGSCIGIGVLDCRTGLGGLAHVMLPGRAPVEAAVQVELYAVNAVEALLARFRPGAIGSACIAGAANVVEDPRDEICAANIDSVLTVLAAHGIRVAHASLGGTARRRVTLDTRSASWSVAIGDAAESVCWTWRT